MLLLDKVEKTFHERIDERMIPKPKKASFFDLIKSNFKGKDKTLVRFKIYDEKP